MTAHPAHHRIYLDHHATTPCDPRVVEAMIPWFAERGGNAASPHCFGWESAEAVHVARSQVATLFDVREKDVLFTAGATESNNIVLQGFFSKMPAGSHLVISAIEHPSVSEVARLLEGRGVEVTRVSVDANGVVDVDRVREALRENTRLCSIMWVNNEIGTIQPVREIAELCAENEVCFHTDAAQAVGRVDVALRNSAVAVASLSAHKFYGPTGIGALIRRRLDHSPALEPVMVGGGQEEGLRPGTLAVPLIVGLGRAAELVVAERESEVTRVRDLRDRFLEAVRVLDGVHVNGSLQRRVDGNLSLAIDGVEAQSLLLELKTVGLSVGSACHSDSHQPSAVLTAIGVDPTRSQCTIRVGIGRPNTASEVDEVAARIVEAVRRFRTDMPASG